MSFIAPVQTILRISPDSVPPDSRAVPAEVVGSRSDEGGGVKGVPMTLDVRSKTIDVSNSECLILAKEN